MKKELELISLKDMPREAKLMLLKELQLGVDEEDYVIYALTGKRVMDKYINEPVKFDNMAIFPFVVLDDNPLSIASWFQENEGEVMKT